MNDGKTQKERLCACVKPTTSGRGNDKWGDHDTDPMCRVCAVCASKWSKLPQSWSPSIDSLEIDVRGAGGAPGCTTDHQLNNTILYRSGVARRVHENRCGVLGTSGRSMRSREWPSAGHLEGGWLVPTSRGCNQFARHDVSANDECALLQTAASVAGGVLVAVVTRHALHMSCAYTYIHHRKRLFVCLFVCVQMGRVACRWIRTHSRSRFAESRRPQNINIHVRCTVRV